MSAIVAPHFIFTRKPKCFAIFSKAFKDACYLYIVLRMNSVFEKESDERNKRQPIVKYYCEMWCITIGGNEHVKMHYILHLLYAAINFSYVSGPDQ